MVAGKGRVWEEKRDFCGRVGYLAASRHQYIMHDHPHRDHYIAHSGFPRTPLVRAHLPRKKTQKSAKDPIGQCEIPNFWCGGARCHHHWPLLPKSPEVPFKRRVCSGVRRPYPAHLCRPASETRELGSSARVNTQHACWFRAGTGVRCRLHVSERC